MKCTQIKKKNIALTVRVPASKSISNRLLILQKTSGIPFEINNLSHADDTVLLNDLLQKAENHHSDKPLVLHCRNCGTAYRFLCAYLACKQGLWILEGSERMQQRPIQALADALVDAGAEIDYLKNRGFPPLQIKGKLLHADFREIDSRQSSQYVSAVAMILPLINRE
ncbi:MAG: 3-phosphoshikimate 1-carboxyvinyltransferase, partial [Bacteroidales bacterium]|nr:3-phosphoshikimate 1-carboxyvinyltransferase [Bacteroidales bacterium]